VTGARVSRFEHELGSGARAFRVPAPALRPHLLQGWPDIATSRSSLPSAWVGGLAQRRTIVGVGPRYGAVDLKLSPLGPTTPLAEHRAEVLSAM
jgi:hypothetical protein